MFPYIISQVAACQLFVDLVRWAMRRNRPFFSPCPCVIRNRYPTLLAVKWVKHSFFCRCILTSGGQRNNWGATVCHHHHVHCMVVGSDLYISFFSQAGQYLNRAIVIPEKEVVSCKMGPCLLLYSLLRDFTSSGPNANRCVLIEGGPQNKQSPQSTPANLVAD